MAKCCDHGAPGAQIWISGEDPFQKVGPVKEGERGEKGARGQESKFLPEKDEESAWLVWNVGRGEAGPASKTS